MTGPQPVTSPPSRRTWVSRFRAFWKAPDEFALDAGRAAEAWIARVRLAIALLAMLIPLGGIASANPAERDPHLAALLIGLVAFLTAVLLFLMVERGVAERWLSMATSLLDVSLVSFGLLAHAFAHQPMEAVESRSGFDLYYLALAATCLRYDARVALVAGLTAIVQYLGIVVPVAAQLAGTLSETAPPFSWLDQAARAGLLASLTGLNLVIVTGLERQRKLSSSDPLTGLFNRRFFDDYLAKEVARANRYHTLFAVAMIDVDHFKKFDDTFGHPAGDRALRTVARVVMRAVRRSDIVARYGGEEIVVIFRETDADAAIERVEGIRRSIEAESFAVGRVAAPARISVSAGVASWPEDGLSVDEILAIADRRMFEAKAAGRNRVVGPPSNDKPTKIALLN